MNTQKNHNISFNESGDVISIETFISCPEALAIDEQIVLKELDNLLIRLRKQTKLELYIRV